MLQRRSLGAPSAGLGTNTRSREIGRDPSKFLALVQEYGPVEACKLMITDPTLGQDLLRLKQAGRLDLTVEALVLRDRFKRLFDGELLGKARKRLVDWNQSSVPKLRLQH